MFALLVLTSVPLLRRCKVSQYCGVACQKAAWKQVHKEECSKFANLIAMKVPDSIAGMLEKHRLDTLKVLGHA